MILSGALISSAGLFALIWWAEGASGIGGFFSGAFSAIALIVLYYLRMMSKLKKGIGRLRDERRSISLATPAVPNSGNAQYGWQVKTLAGEIVPMDAFMRETVFLNFWSTWCAPCVAELGSIERLRGIVEREA